MIASFYNRIKPYRYYITLFLFTLICYSNTISHSFLSNWDDQDNIINNKDVTQFQLGNLKHIFIPEKKNNEYQALSVLYFAGVYKLFKLNPKAYHLFNIFIHFLNVLLVFFLLKILFNNEMRAVFIATAWAVHPLQSEVVSWISAANYLWYVLSLLISMISYVNYIKKRERLFYYLAFLFFLLALLFKSSAVVLPFLLLLIDYYFSRNLFKQLINKIPFFLCAGIFVSIALFQKAKNMVEIPVLFNITDKPFVASNIIINFIFHTIFPFTISLLYSYPEKTNTFLPFFYYISFIILSLIILLIYRYRKQKEMVFGFTFFIITLLPVLHIIPYYHIGFYANRYMYLGLLGLLILISFILYPKNHEKKPGNIRKNILKAISVYLLFMLVFTIYFNKHFSNNIKFFSGVIKTVPESVIANYLMAQSLSFENDYTHALKYYNKAIKYNPAFVRAYYGRGLAHTFLYNFESAINDFSTVLKYDSIHKEALFNRGLSYANTSLHIKAIKDFSKYILLEPNNHEAYNNRGGVYLNINQLQLAMYDFNKALELKPDFAAVYYNRAILYEKAGMPDSALFDYNKAIEIKPDYVQAYNSRAVLKGRDFMLLDEALSDLDMAVSIKPDMLEAHYNKAYIILLKGDTLTACHELKILIDKNYMPAKTLYDIHCNSEHE